MKNTKTLATQSNHRTLRVRRERLRTLTATELTGVAGGGRKLTRACLAQPADETPNA